jgi:putative glutamine amidotransferase
MIGVTANFFHAGELPEVYDGRPLLYLEQSMATWLMRGGARPYMIPAAPEGESVETAPDDLVAGLDGLVLHGGADVAPQTYGQEPLAEEWFGDPVRDAYELALVEAALARDVPILGICRGLQVLNVHFGGTLWQDIDRQVDGAGAHRDLEEYDGHVHPVEMTEGSRLSACYGGRREGRVVSVHHQAVRRLGDGLVVEARAPDGIVEAMRLEAGGEAGWVAALQWHPEFQEPDDDRLLDAQAPLADFLGAVERRK